MADQRDWYLPLRMGSGDSRSRASKRRLFGKMALFSSEKGHPSTENRIGMDSKARLSPGEWGACAQGRQMAKGLKLLAEGLYLFIW